MKEYLKIAYKNIKNRKLRAFLTLIGILISVATKQTQVVAFLYIYIYII